MAERKPTFVKQQPKFTELNDLVSERNGGRVLFATDDWFAVADNLLKAEEPEWHEGEFTECGKWMDGWETRRKRIPGHDWAIIRLGVPGVLYGILLDTAFFTGNYAPRFSLQAAHLSPEEEAHIPHRESKLGGAATPEMLKILSKLGSENWKEIIPMTSLCGGYQDTRHNFHAVDNKESWTHVRLNIYPDGGIARFRLYGEARPNWKDVSPDKLIDLIAMANGGVCVGYSDAHYGHPRNIIRSGRGINMGDGWETARRLDRPCILEADENGILQVPGCEWAVFRLGHNGTITRIEVDTNHFKGNFPDSIHIEGTTELPNTDWSARSWKTLLPLQKLSPHKQHFYMEQDLHTKGPFTYIRVTIAPDGGISRLRLWGYCEHN
ncbi:allantoicase-like isoform X1 [Periplaneta americana]|uniref:allantoicase-like isoform X1 n=1 Tax=Periplaneta americana TaxID=6978 RepID=UPI0037E74DDE